MVKNNYYLNLKKKNFPVITLFPTFNNGSFEVIRCIGHFFYIPEFMNVTIKFFFF